MEDLRTTIGVALLVSLVDIFVLGFFATSGRDLALVLFGFASGLSTVYLLEHLKRARIARGHARGSVIPRRNATAADRRG